MRAVSRDNWNLIVGGMLPPPGSGGGPGGSGGTGGTGGGSGSGGSGGSTDEAEFENAAKAIIELVEHGTIDSGVSGLVFKSMDYAALAAGVNSALFAEGMNDYSVFEATGDHAPPGYINVVSWNHIDWHAYDNNGTATPQQAMHNMLNGKRPATSPVLSDQQLLRYAPVLLGASAWGARRYSGSGIWPRGATAA